MQHSVAMHANISYISFVAQLLFNLKPKNIALDLIVWVPTVFTVQNWML